MAELEKYTYDELKAYEKVKRIQEEIKLEVEGQSKFSPDRSPDTSTKPGNLTPEEVKKICKELVNRIGR